MVVFHAVDEVLEVCDVIYTFYKQHVASVKKAKILGTLSSQLVRKGKMEKNVYS